MRDVADSVLDMYSARLILISGSCKHETADKHAALLQAVVNATNDDPNLNTL